MRRISILRGERETEHTLFVEEISEHNPELVPALLEIDLATYSEPSLTRTTAGSLMRHGRLFLLRADGVPIGAALCVRTWTNPDEVALISQAIRPGWRGFGLGSWFLEQVLQILEQHGVRSVVLHVDCANQRARHIYEEKYDFVPVGGCELEYGPGDGRQMMRRSLP